MGGQQVKLLRLEQDVESSTSREVPNRKYVAGCASSVVEVERVFEPRFKLCLVRNGVNQAIAMDDCRQTRIDSSERFPRHWHVSLQVDTSRVDLGHYRNMPMLAVGCTHAAFSGKGEELFHVVQAPLIGPR